jgi:hypothetical protein
MYFAGDASLASSYTQQDGARILPVFLNTRKPVQESLEVGTQVLEFKKRQGFDGVKDAKRKMFAVLEPSQIKSAIGNVGTFSEQQGDIRFRRTEAGAISDAEASSLFPDVDQRLKAAAQSPGRLGYMQRGKDFLSNMHKAFTRHFIHLDPKQDGAVINILREHQEAANAAWEKAGYTAVSFLKDLSPAERNVFTMNLVLADMIRDIDSELLDGNAELPFGYQSRDQAQKDLDHFQALAERTPAVKATANRSNL